MPSDTPLNKRRTHYDLDRHFELFLEATSLDAMTTKKHSCTRRKSSIRRCQSVDAPYKHTNRGTDNHNYTLQTSLLAFFFRKPKHAARFGQWKNCLEIHLWQTAVCRSCTTTKASPAPYPVPVKAVRISLNYRNFADIKEGVEWTDVAQDSVWPWAISCFIPP